MPMVLGAAPSPAGERSRSPKIDVTAHGTGAGLGFGASDTRGRTEAPPDTATGSPGNNSFTQSTADSFVENAFKKQIIPMQTALAKAMDEPIRAVVADAMGEQMLAVNGRLSTLETGQKTLLEEVAKINTALAKMAHSPSAPALPTAYSASLPSSVSDVTTSPFWRTPDPTILFINVHDRAKLNLRTIYASIVVLATDANIAESEYTFDSVSGTPLDNLFDLKFTGPSASARCLQFYQSLQLGRGRWKEQAAADPQNKIHKFYIAPDKNPAQVRREVLSKQLKTGICALEGWTKEVFVRKSSGTLLVDRRPLVTVKIIDENNASLVWSHANRVAQGMQQEVAEGIFAELLAGGSSP